jgi:hypothetical protein
LQLWFENFSTSGIFKRREKFTTAYENFLDDAFKKFSTPGIFKRREKFTTAYENFLDDAFKNFSTPGIFKRREKFTTAYENFLDDENKNFSIAIKIPEVFMLLICLVSIAYCLLAFGLSTESAWFSEE